MCGEVLLGNNLKLKIGLGLFSFPNSIHFLITIFFIIIFFYYLNYQICFTDLLEILPSPLTTNPLIFLQIFKDFCYRIIFIFD